MKELWNVDHYAQLEETLSFSDVIVGVLGRSVVACALVYAPRTGALVAEDIPWAAKMGEGIGGVTCVCVAGGFPHLLSVGNGRLICDIGDDPDIANMGAVVTVQLLEACAKVLADRGVRGMLVDGIRGGEELPSMGTTPALAS